MIEVPVEHRHLYDITHRQLIAPGYLSDSFWRRAVLDAEGTCVVGADVGVHPSYPLFTVVARDLHTGGGNRLERQNLIENINLIRNLLIGALSTPVRVISYFRHAS